VLSALLFGMIASSALVIGGLYQVGGKSVAFATATGFFVSFAISEL
jgi:hypothetical protein